jgi:ATP-dependent Lon protease
MAKITSEQKKALNENLKKINEELGNRDLTDATTASLMRQQSVLLNTLAQEEVKSNEVKKIEDMSLAEYKKYIEDLHNLKTSSNAKNIK